MTKVDYQYLLVTEDGQRLDIQLNRPEKRNALNRQLIAELGKAFDFAEGNSNIRTVVLKGDEKAFCSGADLAYLKEMRSYSDQENLEDSLQLGELFLKIYTLSKPVIAMVEGPALAGGCGLASVCDFVYASEEAIFGYPEVKIGFVAALVSTFLIRQIGERKARELLLTGKILSANQAHELGLINDIFDRKILPNAVQELSDKLSKNSPQALAVTKRNLLAEFEFAQIESELKRLAKINSDFRRTEDFLEGVTSFIEKRKPQWHSQ